MNNLKRILFGTVILATIVWSMGVTALVPMASAATTLVSGDLIKASGPAVYYYAEDGNRYTFPTLSTYMTWYSDFSTVKTITDDELSLIDLAGNVVIRPGTNLVKIDTVPKVFAVEANGSLLHIADEASATALYGADWASKIVVIPDGFWTNYTDSGETLDGTTYPEGQLVKTADASDIYYINADGTWSKFADEASMTANNFRMADVITTSLAVGTAGTVISGVDTTLIDVSQGGGAVVPSTAGTLTISNSGTPASAYVSKGAQNALFAKYTVTASGGDVEVDKIVLTRKGLSGDDQADAIRLYEGMTQIGTDQSINTNDHTVTFKNLNWTIADGASKTLSVKVNVNASAADTNMYFELTSIDADGSVAGLPSAGNAMSFSALIIGELNVALTTSGAQDVISGEQDVELGCWNFNATANGGEDEGFYLQSIKLTQTGTTGASDVTDLYLKYSSEAISDVFQMDGNTVTFDMTEDPYFLKKSSTKKLCVYGNISAGITIERTVIFQIAETKDVSALSEITNSEVLIETAGAAFSAQSSRTSTIKQGTATIAADTSYQPATGAVIVKGVEHNKMAAYKLTAGSTEGVRLTKLRLTLAGTNVLGTDFTNWELYKMVDGQEELIDVTGSVSGLFITFEDTTNGLLDVEKSESETFLVYADVTTSAAGNEAPKVYIAADAATGTAGQDTYAKIKGLESLEYETDGVATSGVATGDAIVLDINATGTIDVTKAATSPSAATISKGTDAIELLDINFYATGENMEVSDLIVTLYEDSANSTLTNVADTADVTNVKLIDENGEQVGSTCSAPSTGECSFSFSLDVPKDENVVLTVIGDLGTAATGYLYATVYDSSDAGDELTTTGVYSQTDVDESFATATGFAGNVITAGSPALTAYMGTTPVAQSYVTNSNDLTVGTLVLQAGTSEDIKITSIKISADDAATINGASTASAEFTGLSLVNEDDPSIQYGNTLNLTGGTPDYASFAGIDNLTVAAGTTTRILVRADITGSTAGPWYFGVEVPTTDITGKGSSGTDLTAAMINSGTTTAIASTAATVASVGTLKVTASSGRASAAQFVAGTTGNSLMSYKFQSTIEEVDVTELYVATTSGTARQDVYRVKLYLDGEIIGDASGYSLDTGGDAYIVLPAGTFVVPKDPEYKTLDIKVDFGTKTSLTDAATLEIGLGDVTGVDTTWGSNGAAAAGSYKIVAKGVSSGTTLTETTIDSLGTNAGNVIASYVHYLYDGILTVALNTSSPSGTATGEDNSELMRFDLTATGDEITIGALEFCYSGVATHSAGTGNITLKSSDLQTTYGTITPTEFDAYWDDFGGNGSDLDASVPFKSGVDTAEQCFSFGDASFLDTVTVYNQATASEDSTGKAMDSLSEMKIPQGQTSTFKVFGDTTGFTTNDSLKITIRENSTSANKVTTAGVIWENNGGTDVDSSLTKNLPVSGGTLSY